ncbi:MAG TPA: hypothetical protein VGD90_09490 [Sphingobacteriaceae bacterium]
MKQFEFKVKGQLQHNEEEIIAACIKAYIPEAFVDIKAVSPDLLITIVTDTPVLSFKLQVLSILNYFLKGAEIRMEELKATFLNYHLEHPGMALQG